MRTDEVFYGYTKEQDEAAMQIAKIMAEVQVPLNDLERYWRYILSNLRVEIKA